MAVKDILQLGNPKLKAKNKVISDFSGPQLQQVVQDLIDTMHKNDLVGIAAPQIGQNYQIIVTEPRQTKTRTADQSDELRVYLNPKIINYSRQTSIIYEGCGSVVHGELFGPVSRPQQITIEAFDLRQHKFQLKCNGLLARVIQHEYDHLSGIEFTEKITDYSKLLNREFYLKKIKFSPAQIRFSRITLKQHSTA